MNILTWAETQASGLVMRDAERELIKVKPTLSFAFDSIYFEPTNKFKVIGLQNVLLSKEEVAECNLYIANAVINMMTHAVDASGAYLGFVEATPDSIEVKFPPPNSDHYRYDFESGSWVYIIAVDLDGKYIGNVPVGGYDLEVPTAPSADYERWDESTKTWYDARTLDEHKLSKVMEAKYITEGMFDKLVSIYPVAERDTWADQEREAKAYLADNTSPTPLLNITRQSRTITMLALTQKIVDKAILFRQQAMSIINRRKIMTDEIKACTTIAEVKSLALL